MKRLIFALSLVCTATAGPVPGASLRIPIDKLNQFQTSDSDGRFEYGYHYGDSFKVEHRTSDGIVTGSYSYVDPYGILRRTDYISDSHGFRATQHLGPSPQKSTGIKKARVRLVPLIQAIPNNFYPESRGRGFSYNTTTIFETSTASSIASNTPILTNETELESSTDTTKHQQEFTTELIQPLEETQNTSPPKVVTKSITALELDQLTESTSSNRNKQGRVKIKSTTEAITMTTTTLIHTESSIQDEKRENNEEHQNTTTTEIPTNSSLPEDVKIETTTNANSRKRLQYKGRATTTQSSMSSTTTVATTTEKRRNKYVFKVRKSTTQNPVESTNLPTEPEITTKSFEQEKTSNKQPHELEITTTEQQHESIITTTERSIEPDIITTSKQHFETTKAPLLQNTTTESYELITPTIYPIIIESVGNSGTNNNNNFHKTVVHFYPDNIDNLNTTPETKIEETTFPEKTFEITTLDIYVPEDKFIDIRSVPDY